ncbi:MAG TPA: translocation/assembly module TamB domain-containing protein, partial [Gemmatimonadaceae bacterium]|nr:translocation/assembly module TamB domain-containing protein [Gemmatimonadaceae bacterium]
PTLPRSGGGRADVHIYNNHDNLHAFEYAISNMDVQSTRSRLQGAMTFGVGGPVLTVRDVNLRANPVNFDLLRTLAGGPFPTDWQGDLYGFAQGPGGPLTHFVVDQSDLTWRDTHVRGAVSRFGGSGELDILYPAYTIFHGFKVNVASLDLRSIEYLFPSFPRIHGAASGTAVLDSSWMDVRFSNANVFHRFGPGDPSHVTGSGRVTYGEQFMTYDVNVTAQPVSLTMLSRAYPLGLRGLFNGPIQVKGQSDSMQLAMDLTGPAGRITYSGFVDAYPLSVAARGTGRVERLDPSLLVAKFAVPSGALTGNYQLDVRGDTSDLATLAGNATVLLERSDFDGLRLSPSRVRARFADGRVYLDTVRVESVAGVFSASGALGLSPAHPDSLHYEIVVDTLGGLRRYITPFLSSWAQPANVATVDSLAGTVTVTGVLRGSVQRVDVAGQVQGRDLYVRRDAGKHVTGSFALSDIMTGVRGTAAVRFDAVSLGGIALDSLAASVRFDQPRSGQFSIGAQSTNGVRFTTLGDVALTDSGSTMRVRDLALVAEGGSQWRLAGPADIATRGRGIAIDSLVLVNGAGGRVALQGGVPDSGKAKFLFRADSVALSDIGRVAQLTRPLEGWAHITAQGAGTNDAPVVNVQTQLADVRYGGVHLERVNATAAYANRRADVTLNLGSGGRTALLANGQLPLEIRYFGARLLDDSLHASVRTDSASFDIVEALLPGLRDATGNLTANLTVAGTWKHPDLAGGLRVDNGEVTVDPLGVRMKGVNVDVALFGHSDSLAIRRIVGWSGTNASDSLSLHGYVAYRDVEDPYLSLVLNARTFHALDKRSLARLDVSTEAGGVRLRGRLHGATLTGGLVVDRGTIFLPDPQLARKQVVDLTSQFADTLEATRQLVPTPPSNVLESLIIDGVRVTLGDDVWLRSDEANIKLVGTLNVQRGVRRGALVGADSLKPVLEGELRAERGTYTLTLGPAVQREFQVEGGTITFVPDPDEVAQLNISALHTVHTVRNENKADIRIRVRLTGPLYPNPIVTLESAESFPLSQSDAVSYLIFGQPNFELGTQDQSYVQVAVQTIYPTLQTVAQSSLRNVLGPWADIVQVRPGSSDASNFEQNSAQFFNDVFWTSRLGAEKQLTENVYVSLSTGICQLRPSNSQTSDQWLDFYNGLSGKIEWRLSENSSLKAGKEPSGLICNRSTSGRLLPTPSQWGLSLFKTWRF